MKTLLLLLLLLPLGLWAQSRKNTTIIVQTSDSSEAVLRNMVQILTAQGYGIQTADKDLGILTTTEKGFKSGSTSLNIQVADKQVVIRGSLRLPGISSPLPIEYKGAKGSPVMRGWEEMAAVARAYPNASLSYR